MRLQTNWGKISPGDIISFRYRTKGELKLHTILVMGVGIPYRKKDGKTSNHLVGVKIEERNLPVNAFQSDRFLKEMKKLGDIQLVRQTKTNEAIIKIDIGGFASKKVAGDFNRIKTYVENFTKKSKVGTLTGGYRTYDYIKARTKAVYYEPILIRPYTLQLIIENKFED
jgi:predicted NUDIX family phosphoesterase